MQQKQVHPFLSSLRTGHGGKVVSATDAVRLIRDGDTVATGGFVGIGFAEGIAVALEALYLAEDRPRDRLTACAAAPVRPSPAQQGLPDFATTVFPPWRLIGCVLISTDIEPPG